MEYPLSRMELLLGPRAIQKLNSARVLVAGLGGVGSYACEALVRGGVGHLILVDNDTVSPSNLNRQLIADTRTIGAPKTRVMSRRIAAINPDCVVETRELFILPENAAGLLEPPPDYVVDAVDTVSAKIALAVECASRGIPIISCMGTGNKLDPTRFRVADLFSTSVCPLCRVMRKELRNRGIAALEVVYSDEEPLPPHPDAAPPDVPAGKWATPGSVSFVPPVAGMIAVGTVIKNLINPHHD